jgi:acetyl-CoA acetyltransferase
VGVGESDQIGRVPTKSALSLSLEAVRNAADEAGISIGDIDGVFSASHSPLTVAEALGITPRYIDGTWVGGCSVIIMAGHAVAALHHGLCDVALITHGQSGHSRIGGGGIRSLDPVVSGQFEAPFGFAAAAPYFALIATRHMHEYGTTLEDWARVATSTRAWATLNPRAMYREPLTVREVLTSRPICYPFNRLNVCLLTDGGGAVLMTRADRAVDGAKRPVYVLGSGEGAEHVTVSQMRRLTASEATRLSGEKAFTMADMTPADIDHVMLYDAFTSGPPIMLESLGFAAPGEGARFFDEGRATPGGRLPINTNGGGLSYTHTGMYGIFPIIEATRQLRGECGPRQVPGVRRSLVNGMGGMLSAAGTLILSGDRG